MEIKFREYSKTPPKADFRKYSQQGFGIIEIVVAVSISTALILALVGTAQLALRVERNLVNRAQASFLAEEGLEATHILRDISWSANIDATSLTSGSIHYPVFSTSTSSWTLVTSAPSPIDGIFTRTLIASDVYRDGSTEDIVASTTPGATVDAGTRHMSVNVLWAGGGSGVTTETYLADLFDN